MSTKLNQTLQNWPRGTVALQSWLTGQGVTRQLAREYCNGHWLERIGHGAYVQANDKVDWKGAVFALQNHAKLDIWPGGQTALALQGYAHYLPLARENVFLFAASGVRLPAWTKKHDWGVQLRFRPITLFSVSGADQANEIDLECANLGSGKRQVVKDGVLNQKYQITVPREFQHGPR